MRAHIPAQLTLDLFDSMAWIAVVPFRMSGVVPRGLPDIPWISAFPELNVRTYVTAPAPPGAGISVTKPGVYFFSLEAANPLAVTIARQLFKLPYFNADMSLDYGDQGDKDVIHYVSHRTHDGAPPADFVGSYGPTGEVYHSQPGTLESWLTERYCLYTTHDDKLYRAEIHHLPWPLQPATAEISTNTMSDAAGITLPSIPPLLHFARRLDIVVWPLAEVS
jgi:uncharacterized protein YqjF (DUF2071 family)